MSSPEPIDIDTPDGSILGVDDETQYTFQWDEQQQQLIEAHRNFYHKMLCFVDELEKKGPVGKIMPKKPKGDLKTLIGNQNKKESKLLFGKNLHKYLVQKLAKTETVTCHTVSEVGVFSNLKDILDNLKSGYDLLKKQNAATLSCYLDYGEWLNVAFELHSIEKLAGKVSGTWKEWLEKNVGIQDSYARKLREISKLLGKYCRFRSVGLSFSELYQHRKQIQAMLTTDNNVAQFWQQAN